MNFIHLPMKMEPIVSSETSAIKSQTPGNYSKRNKLHLQHGESLRTRFFLLVLFTQFIIDKIKKKVVLYQVKQLNHILLK